MRKPNRFCTSSIRRILPPRCQKALLNTDVPPVAVRTVASKPALPEPVVKMPELTIGGKVKRPGKQTEMERYRLPQTTESITRERIDNTIKMANPEDGIKCWHSAFLLGNSNTNTGSARGRAQAGKPQAGTVRPCRISTAKVAKAVMAVCIRSMSRPAVKATKVTEAVPDQGHIPAAAAQTRGNDSPGRGMRRLF